jgi:hypothetical protein
MAAESELKLIISAQDRASEVARRVEGAYGRLTSALDRMNAKAIQVRQTLSQWSELQGIFNRLILGASALLAAIGAIAWKAGQAAADEERFQMRLRALFGPEMAQQMIRYTEEFAKKYGFYVEDVKEAVSMLAGVIIRKGVDIRDALTLVGRIAAGTGRPLIEVAQAVMMAYQGWPRALRGVTEGFIDVKGLQQVYTEHMLKNLEKQGKAQKEVQEAQEQVEEAWRRYQQAVVEGKAQQINREWERYQRAVKKAQEIMAETGKIGETMGDMVAGGMEEIELSAEETQRITQYLLQQTTPLQSALEALPNTVAAAWERMRSQIRETWEELGFALAPYLIKFMQLFRQFFENLMSWITQNRPALETLGNTILGIANTVMKMVVWLGNFLSQHEWLAQALAKWAPYITVITLVTSLIIKLVIWIARAAETFKALGIVSAIGRVLGLGGAIAGAAGAGTAGAGAAAAAGAGALGIAGGILGWATLLPALAAGAAGLGTYLGTRHYLAPWTRAQKEVAEYQSGLMAMSSEERRRRLWGLPPRQYATPVVVQGDIMTRDWADAQMLQRMQNEFGYGGVY